ncbi:MAG TPA: site-2 protease family protein [Pirellulales bacterium]|nr:site-2 protease family protein [Pirellulales bacterium]
MSYPTPSWPDESQGGPMVLPETAVDPADRQHVRPRRLLLPLLLFGATCLSTLAVGGPIYAAAIMFILLSHELGHYVQARRYHVPASLPYFIPFPLSPLGTMGAVIGMSGQMPNRRVLFDVGISGPLAGLVPALACSVVGLYWSDLRAVPPGVQGMLGDPLLFQWIVKWFFGPIPPGHDVILHSLAYAGWVGVLITSVNLFPIGQLDGGHVLYAILREKAHLVATFLLLAALAAVIYTRTPQWSLMLVLLLLMGPNHAPTANDDEPLTRGRVILGWLTLAFLLIGFTPRPFNM